MTSERYETKTCERCAGTGQRYDATSADKVCAGGAGAVQCSACRGAGTVSVLIPSADFLAYRERERAALAALYAEPGGELPDWMLGD